MSGIEVNNCIKFCKKGLVFVLCHCAQSVFVCLFVCGSNVIIFATFNLLFASYSPCL